MFLTTNSLLFNALVDVNNCENGLGERRTLGFLTKFIEKGFVFYDERKLLDESKNDQKNAKNKLKVVTPCF